MYPYKRAIIREHCCHFGDLYLRYAKIVITQCQSVDS